MPYPIDEVRLPKVTRQNIIEIGMRAGVGTRAVTDVPLESLMLTGDENIIDIHCVVFRRIKNGRVGADVATRTPHGTGCADFPLPVLHGRASLTVV